MSAEQNLNEHDNELLSAYLDNALTDVERTALEARLAREPALRRELNALRQTVALVRGLPTLKAPRDFVLTPELVAFDRAAASTPTAKRRAAPRTVIPFPVMSFMSAAASMALILFGFILIVNQSSEPAREQNQSQASVSLDSNTIPSDEIAYLGTKVAEDAAVADETLAMAGAAEAQESAESFDMENVESASADSGSGLDNDTVVEGTPSPAGTPTDEGIALSAPAAVMDDTQGTTTLSYGTPTPGAVAMPTFEPGVEIEQPSAGTFRQNVPLGEAGAAPATMQDGVITEEMRSESFEPPQEDTAAVAQAPPVAPDNRVGSTNDLETLQRETGVLVPAEAESTVTLDGTNAIDASSAGLIMIAAGLLLAFITLLMRRMRSVSGRR